MQLDLNPKNKENSIMIKIKTTSGDIEIKLYEEEAPISSENFKSYVKDGFFEGTIFHRVIPNFMVQGGGMTENMENKSTNAPIKNEANNGKKNLRGTLAMASSPIYLTKVNYLAGPSPVHSDAFFRSQRDINRHHC